MAVLLPAIIFMWIVGWAFYWIGHQKEGKNTATPSSKLGTVTLTAAGALEEKQLEVSG